MSIHFIENTFAGNFQSEIVRWECRDLTRSSSAANKKFVFVVEALQFLRQPPCLLSAVQSEPNPLGHKIHNSLKRPFEVPSQSGRLAASFLSFHGQSLLLESMLDFSYKLSEWSYLHLASESLLLFSGRFMYFRISMRIFLAFSRLNIRAICVYATNSVYEKHWQVLIIVKVLLCIEYLLFSQKTLELNFHKICKQTEDKPNSIIRRRSAEAFNWFIVKDCNVYNNKIYSQILNFIISKGSLTFSVFQKW